MIVGDSGERDSFCAWPSRHSVALSRVCPCDIKNLEKERNSYSRIDLSRFSYRVFNISISVREMSGDPIRFTLVQ